MLDLDLQAEEVFLTAEETRLLTYAEKVAYVMDGLLPVPGTDFRFGLDGLLGIAPGVGDGVTALAPLSVIAMGMKAGLPKGVVARMLFNVGYDMVVGAIPLIGDLADFGMKANRKNLTLLKQHYADHYGLSG